MRLKTILFDLDGTLVDSAISISAILNNMRKEQGLASLDAKVYRKWISLGAVDLIANAMEVNQSFASQYLDQFRRRYEISETSEQTLYPKIVEVLKILDSMNIKMGICSNKPTQLCHKVLQDTGIDKYFLSVVGGDAVTSSKPSREPVDYALRELNHADGIAILIGDSTVDHRAAIASQIPFVFFSGGYDDGVDLGEGGDSIACMDELIPLIKNRKWIL